MRISAINPPVPPFGAAAWCSAHGRNSDEIGIWQKDCLTPTQETVRPEGAHRGRLPGGRPRPRPGGQVTDAGPGLLSGLLQATQADRALRSRPRGERLPRRIAHPGALRHGISSLPPGKEKAKFLTEGKASGNKQAEAIRGGSAGMKGGHRAKSSAGMILLARSPSLVATRGGVCFPGLRWLRRSGE